MSPYFPSPGFGVDEYPLPPGAEIIQVHVSQQLRLSVIGNMRTVMDRTGIDYEQMLSRHGARYPTLGAPVIPFAKRIEEAKEKFNATGRLAFLNDWKYELGHEILVPKGKPPILTRAALAIVCCG